ncbi:MAG: NAD(P)H-dependent oxidoreductase [Pelolinea sp.]|nr:NAD(P)H-dependent oxidoreductase [Pelolinea sp.]
MKQILGIPGSLRKNSFNKTLLQSASTFILEGYSFQMVDLGTIPLYNDDLALENPPSAVVDFRNNIQQADGILIASAEYNYSFSGVLKNALDWAATNTIGNVLNEKPTAIMGASKGVFGTARSQLVLRQVLLAANANVVQRPEVYVRSAGSKIDKNGIMIDEYTQEKIKQLLTALMEKIDHQ